MKLRSGLILFAAICIAALAATWNIAASASLSPMKAQKSLAANTPPFLSVGGTYWVYYTYSPAVAKQQITVLEIGSDGWIKVKTHPDLMMGMAGLEASEAIWLNTNAVLAIKEVSPTDAATKAASSTPPTARPTATPMSTSGPQ